MVIKNESKICGQYTNDLRAFIEHRATWFYLLLKEVRERNLDWENIGRKAVLSCGKFHGNNKFTKTSDLKEFAHQFANDTVKKVFEMEIKELTESKFVVEFNYCPLVAAWLKLTNNEDDIATLCDIAMDGDRGIISTFNSFDMQLGETIASGDKVCRLTIYKK
ncbi:L-2-amino-thiazoline-4-carboxylic acid hydrolase [bacterium]|nr:L-2-amino-thiazoline-4-carboxylic acid hydrolase [bacterium]